MIEQLHPQFDNTRSHWSTKARRFPKEDYTTRNEKMIYDGT